MPHINLSHSMKVTPRNKAYCYAELTVSSSVEAETIAHTYC